MKPGIITAAEMRDRLLARLKRYRPGTIVEHNGRRGVAVDDFMSSCADDETPVVFEGSPAFCGTATAELVEIGPENPVADLDKCGGGKGAACCIFLTMGPKGAECQRHTSMRYTLIFRKMGAQRHPLKPFPACQDLTDDP